MTRTSATQNVKWYIGFMFAHVNSIGFHRTFLLGNQQEDQKQLVSVVNSLALCHVSGMLMCLNCLSCQSALDNTPL